MSDVYDDPGSDGALVEDEVRVEDLVRHAIDIVSSAKAMPLSASVLVSREEVVDLLEAALDRLPPELREARWILREQEEFMAERQSEAAQLMEDVRAQAERMVSRTEIVRQANQVAQRISERRQRGGAPGAPRGRGLLRPEVGRHGDRARPDPTDGQVRAGEAAGDVLVDRELRAPPR